MAPRARPLALSPLLLPPLLALALACDAGAGVETVVIAVDPGNRSQVWQGAGAALTYSSAQLLSEASAALRESVLQALFSPDGIALNLLRQPMGTSDFRPQPPGDYTYADTEGPAADPLASFSTTKDTACIVPMLRRCLAHNPGLQLYGLPWSPPAWMKTPQSLLGGSLGPIDPRVLAAYFLKYIQAYEGSGFTFWGVGLQNEPGNANSKYPTCRQTPANQSALAVALGEALRTANRSAIRLVVYDHNWDNVAFPLAVLASDAARPFIDGVAFHCYGGDVRAQAQVHARFPGKNIYLTECTASGPPSWAGGDFVWALTNLVIGNARNWGSAVFEWNLALDAAGGPKMPGGCTNCRGLVRIDTAKGQAEYSPEFYALGHVSKFVPPGSWRIQSNQSEGAATAAAVGPWAARGVVGSGGGLLTLAFLTPNGTVVLVAANAGSANRTLVADVPGRGRASFCCLPPLSAATLVWPPDAAHVGVWLSVPAERRMLTRQPDVPVAPASPGIGTRGVYVIT